MYRLTLFGTASIEGPDGIVAGRAVQRRRLALLALLASARRGLMRDRLIAWLWPDADVERARAMLSDSVYRINQAVGGEAIVGAGDELRLNHERLPSDVHDFTEAMERGAWARAVELQPAPFLDGFYLTGADEFERWVEVERDRYRRERGRALEMLVDHAESAGDTPAAAHWARLLAHHDPYSSRYALRCLRALEQAGERAAALQHARVHTVLLRDEMGLEPDPAIAAFEAQLRAAGAPGVDTEPAAQPMPGAPGVGTDPERPSGRGGDAGSKARPSSDAFRDNAGPSAGPWTAPPTDAVITRSAGVRGRRLLLTVSVATLAALVLLAIYMRPPAVSAPTAIAVLPFEDLSPGGDQEYFADGITEELIVRLGRIDGMNVVGRTSAFALRDSALDVREMARRLGVDLLLAGSVRPAGDRLRIVAQLLDAGSGYQLWAETYERDAEDVFAIQDEIAHEIATRLRGSASEADASRLAGMDSTDLVAYDHYLRGRYEWHRRTESGLRAAARYFGLATERAPSYAPAWVGLGDAHAVLGFYDYLPPDSAFPFAAEAARRALELDPDNAAAHATLGYTALYYDYDWTRAESEFRQVVELDPDYSTGRQWYANFLTARGRFDEAEDEMRAAQLLDPLSLIANAALGFVLYYAGHYERAIDQCTRTLELNPDFELAYLWRGMAREELGHYDAAIEDLERAVTLSQRSAITVAALARTRALAGQRERAVALLQELEADPQYVPAFEIAKVLAALGETTRAHEALERAFAQRSHSMAFLAVDPQLASVRDHPRFRLLLEKLEQGSSR